METKTLSKALITFILAKSKNIDFCINCLTIIDRYKMQCDVEICDINTKYGMSIILNNSQNVRKAISLYNEMYEKRPYFRINFNTKEITFLSDDDIKYLINQQIELLITILISDVERYQRFWKEFFNTEIL